MDQTPRIIKTRTVLAVTAMLACLPASFAGDGGMAYGGYYGGTSDISNRASARFQSKTESAMATMEKGRELYKEGEYEKALETFQSALNELPDSPMTADRRKYGQELVATASVAVAQQYRKTGRYEEAEALLKKVLETNPKNAAAKQELAYLKDPVRTNPALTPKHVENVKEVNLALRKGYGFYDLGQYDEASRQFDAVLRIDPYNIAARRGKETVNNAKMRYYETAYDEARSQMLAQVSATWEIPVPMDAPKASDNTGMGSLTTGGTSPATANLMKLKNIIIPSVDFENTTVEEAIDFLRTRSRALDTTPGTGEKGINFLIRTGSGSGSSAAPAATETLDLNLEGDGEAAPAAPAAPSGSVIIPELKLRNVPLLEVLKFITDTAGMRYKIEDYAVVILPSGQNDTDLFSKTFTVPPNFQSALESAAGGGGADATSDPFSSSDSGSTSSIKPREPVDVLFKKMGVAFPAGATANFIPGSASLIVRNTPGNLDMIEQFIDTIKNTSPKQVKITTKFVEVSQDNTDELSFDWVVSPIKVGGADRYLGGGTMGNGTPNRLPGDFAGAPSGSSQWVDGITGSSNAPVDNIVTGGNRTGDGAIKGNAINNLINNPNRTQKQDTTAPGIMSFSGIFDQGSMQVIMRGLSQKKGTDVMTAPSITAKSGATAKIEIVREFIYPTDYTEPQLPNSVGNTDTGRYLGNNDGILGGNQAQVSSFPVTPSTPTGFQTRPVGVTLEIQPNIAEGDYVIDFKFTPEIVEFDGFINYGSPISTAGTDAEGQPVTVTITENRIEMPVFSTRKVDTEMTIYDGHTVAIGGLMQESVQTVEDKVPVLGDLPLVGRLFRSEASNHVKTNLIIFVTGDIIDATGRPVRSRETEMGIDAATATPVSAEEGLLPTM